VTEALVCEHVVEQLAGLSLRLLLGRHLLHAQHITLLAQRLPEIIIPIAVHRHCAVIHETGGTKSRLVDVETGSLLLLSVITHWDLVDERHWVTSQVEHLLWKSRHHSELVATL
jgi:hypothetical protein